MSNHDQRTEISRTPEQFAADEPCWICGAMDHDSVMIYGQKAVVCPQCPDPMIWISIPNDWLPGGDQKRGTDGIREDPVNRV